MFKKALIACAIIAAAAGAQAQTASLTIGGTISPSSCAISLTAGGAINVGTLSSSAVQKWTSDPVLGETRYLSPGYPVALDITCPAPAKLAYSIVDNRAASQPFTGAGYKAILFGLGKTGAVNNGAYHINSAPMVTATTGGTLAAAGTKLTTAGVATSASTWTAASDYILPGNSYGYGVLAGVTTPDSVAQLNDSYIVNLDVLKTAVDSATSALTLDGSATLSLVLL